MIQKKGLWLFFIIFFISCIDAKTTISLKDIDASCDHPKNFNQQQLQVLIQSYEFGKTFGFEWLLPAIAWQESCAGIYQINFQDPSAGVFHALIPSVIKQYSTLRDTQLNRNRIGQFLIQNFDFAKKVARNEILFWNKKYKGDLEKIIKSYNKGTKWQSNKQSQTLANRYHKQIIEKINILKEFFKDLNNKNITPTNKKKKKHATEIHSIDKIQQTQKQENFILLQER